MSVQSISLHQAHSYQKKIDTRIYPDCTWILEKATFLKENHSSLSKFAALEEQIKSSLRSYLEKWKMDEFFMLLEQTVLSGYAMLFSIEKPSPNDVLNNPYKDFLSKCDELKSEILAAHEDWYSMSSNLLWSNKTMVSIAVRDLLRQNNDPYIFWE
jgi:hypothetical protein